MREPRVQCLVHDHSGDTSNVCLKFIQNRLSTVKMYASSLPSHFKQYNWKTWNDFKSMEDPTEYKTAD